MEYDILVSDILNNKEFYDYNAKYINETVTTTNPILNKKVKKQIKKISKKIFTQLDCKVLARIDFLYDDDNEILYLNEINTLPGFTEISMYPKLLTSNNITYKNLITSIIKSSLN